MEKLENEKLVRLERSAEIRKLLVKLERSIKVGKLRFQYITPTSKLFPTALDAYKLKRKLANFEISNLKLSNFTIFQLPFPTMCKSCLPLNFQSSKHPFSKILLFRRNGSILDFFLSTKMCLFGQASRLTHLETLVVSNKSVIITLRKKSCGSKSVKAKIPNRSGAKRKLKGYLDKNYS